MSELAPAQVWGALNIFFHLFLTIGILIAGIINFFTSNIHPQGWRISLGFSWFILLVGSLVICETSTSLIEHNKVDDRKIVPKRIQGVDDAQAEFDLIASACEWEDM